MSGRFFWGISAAWLRGFLTALTIASFLFLSATAYAEEITYTGDKKGLRAAPYWISPVASNDLFPGTAGGPLSSNNKVTVDYTPAPDKEDVGIVFGGLCALGNTANNEIVLLRGQINRGMSGGWSGAGDAVGNVVTISNGRVLSSVNGGTTRRGNAVNNTLTMNGGLVSVELCAGASYNGNVSGNKVVVNGGQINDVVCGGWSGDGDADGNNMTISGGVIAGRAAGGRTSAGNATGNTAAISGGTVDRGVFGGWSELGGVTGNTLIISGGSIDGNAAGGYGDKGKANDNTVTISGGEVGSDVYGGLGGGDAMGNTVTISGGSVGSDVYGGRGGGDVTGNTVDISGGSVGGDIISGMSFNGNATGNTLTISGSPDMEYAFVLGGYSENADRDAFSGNTLNFKSSGISAKAVGYFEYYNFYLAQDIKAETVMLSVKYELYLAKTTVEIFLPDDTKLKKGDKIALIHSAKGVIGAPKNKNCKAKHGGAIYEFSIYTDKNNLWAKVTKVSGAAK